MRYTLKSSIVTLAVLLVSFSSQAQLRLPGLMQRFEIGYSFVSTSGDYKGKFSNFDPNTFADTAVSKSGNVKTSAAYGITLGTYFPLTRGEKGCLALDVSYLYNFMLWKGIGDGIYGTAAGWDFSGVTIQMGLPVGLEYKFGSDATLSKQTRFCASFGAGAFPTYNLTSFEDGVGSQFNVSPYIKAEAGIFAGICMKARLTYAFTNTPYISKDNGFGGEYDKLLSDFTLTSKPTVLFSLIFMPFSWNWPDNGWWTRTDTSPKMYKGWKARHKNYY